jgi:TIGR03009 family protein
MAAQVLAVWAIGGSAASSQEPEPRNEPPMARARADAPAGAVPARAKAPDPAKMDWLLKQWEKQSSLLKTLDVTILRIDNTPAWDDLEYYEGRALFKSPNLAFINFEKIKQDENKKPVKDPQNKDPKKTKYLTTPYERIICTGKEVWQYKSDTQQIFIFPLQKDEQEKAIEEGPLPFLFNMKADDARKRYQMTLMTEDQASYGVSIKPRLQVDQESFSLAFVKLDKRFLLPVYIKMVSPDGKSQKEFRLGPMYPNKPVNEKNFEGKPLGPPWKVVRNPAGEERPGAGMTRGRREGPGAPAAARSAPAAGAQRR